MSQARSRRASDGGPLVIVRLVVLAALLSAGTTLAPPGALGQAAPAWVEPVEGVVTDGFRPPSHVGAPGNRGWEYQTTPGAVVVASGSGTVAFAGVIGSHRYVSVQHAGGLRTTYSWLAGIDVVRGQSVAAGERLGTSTGTLHFGVREGSRYLDPAVLFGHGSGAPRLVSLAREGGAQY